VKWSMSDFGRIIVVTRKTRLQEMLERFVTEAQARFYVEHMGLSFTAYEEAHRAYLGALAALRAAIPPSPRHWVIDRSFLPTFSFDDRDLVITLGTNGLVANTAKYAAGRPILGVNADPDREESIVTAVEIGGFEPALANTLGGRLRTRRVTLAEARLNDGQRILAFNDLFIGHRGHVSARYHIEHDGAAEDQCSSGIIVSTGAGSTGWMRSVVAGAFQVTKALRIESTRPDVPDPRFDWSADNLLFAVREPWPSQRTGASVVFGRIAGRPLRLVSQMPEGGVIFSDGVAEDALAFTSGAVAEVGVAEDKANLVFFDSEREADGVPSSGGR